MRLEARHALVALLLGLGVWIAAQPLRAASQRAGLRSQRIFVVVNAANPVASLERLEIRRIFLRERTVWPNGWPIAVFERSSDHPIRGEFSSAVLGRTPAQLAEYWLNLSLTRGLEPPKVCRTPSLLKHYLDRVKGGVGYVYENEVESGMKIVARIEPEDL